MKLTKQQSQLIKNASDNYAIIQYPIGSPEESVAFKAHDYGMRRVMMSPEKYGLMPVPSKEANRNAFGYKAFKILFGGERYWICARTEIEALQTMVTDVGIEFSDFDHEDSIEVIPTNEWPALKIVDPETDLEIHDELEVLETLEEHMSIAKTPGFIASTDY